jgi:hypothetical protein
MIVSTVTWSERNVTLDGRPFRRDEWPQIVPFMDAMDRGEGRIIIGMMPPQRGKTLAAQLRLARNLAVSPRRQLWYSKTQVDSRSIADSKLGPLLASTAPVLRTLYTDPDRRGRNLTLKYHDSPVELLSADCVPHRNSRSGQEIFLDEAWQYEPRAIAEIMARGDSYRWRRQVNISTTASDVGHELEILWSASTRNEWHVACPHCGHVFVPRWSKEMFPVDEVLDADGRINVEASAPTCRMVTPCCHVETPWTQSTMRTMSDTSRGAGYRQTNPTPDPCIDGFTFSVLAADDWRLIARDWLRAVNAVRGGDKQPLREFHRKKLCKPWDDSRESQVSKTEIETGPYMLGDRWDQEATDERGRPMRFMFVDVQKNHFWGVIRSFSQDGRSRLVAFAKLLTEYDIAEFAERHSVLHGRWYETTMPNGQRVIVPETRVCLDAKYSPGGLVPRICSTHGFAMLRSYRRAAFKHSDGMMRIYDEGTLIDPMAGTFRQEIGAKRIFEFKFLGDACKDRIQILRDQKDDAGVAYWTAATDAPDEYRMQVNGEEKKKVYSNDGVSYEWRWKPVRKDNHALDCEAGIIALASMAGLLGDDSVHDPTL